jgi:hypothetical protein
MMKLFRNIRQNLLAQGRVTRYMTFAIGEIVPVVIGFLTAHRFSRPRPIPGFQKDDRSGLAHHLENQ